MKVAAKPSESKMLRAQAEAAAWMALLHSPERNAALEAGFRRWMVEDPNNAPAWEAATDVWNETGGLHRRVPRRRLAGRQGTSYLGPALAVAILCLLAAAGVLVSRLLMLRRWSE